MEVWVPPEHSAAAAHLGFGSWRVEGTAVSPGEVPVFCALPFLLPLPVSVPLWPETFGHGYYPEAGWVRCWSAKILG